MGKVDGSMGLDDKGDGITREQLLLEVAEAMANPEGVPDHAITAYDLTDTLHERGHVVKVDSARDKLQSLVDAGEWEKGAKPTLRNGRWVKMLYYWKKDDHK